jgi:hypothetical protein
MPIHEHVHCLWRPFGGATPGTKLLPVWSGVVAVLNVPFVPKERISWSLLIAVKFWIPKSVTFGKLIFRKLFVTLGEPITVMFWKMFLFGGECRLRQNPGTQLIHKASSHCWELTFLKITSPTVSAIRRLLTLISSFFWNISKKCWTIFIKIQKFIVLLLYLLKILSIIKQNTH